MAKKPLPKKQPGGQNYPVIKVINPKDSIPAKPAVPWNRVVNPKDSIPTSVKKIIKTDYKLGGQTKTKKKK